MITAYSFGSMEIDGKVYTADLIIHASGIKDKWWRKDGHGLCLEDIKDHLTPDISRLVVGCGAYGVLKVGKDVRDFCEKEKIELQAFNTAEAVEAFNKVPQNTVGAFHLTC